MRENRTIIQLLLQLHLKHMDVPWSSPDRVLTQIPICSWMAPALARHVVEIHDAGGDRRLNALLDDLRGTDGSHGPVDGVLLRLVEVAVEQEGPECRVSDSGWLAYLRRVLTRPTSEARCIIATVHAAKPRMVFLPQAYQSCLRGRNFPT